MVQSFEFSLNELDDDIDIVCLIGDVIKNSNKIENVIFPRSYLKNDAFEILYDYINNHTSLKFLRFSMECFSEEEKMLDKNINYIDNIIKSSNIEDIYGLDHVERNYFFESLLTNYFRRGNPKVDFSGRYMDDEHLFKLSDMIIDKNINYLREIVFTLKKISPHGFSKFIGSLLKSNNESIVKISMHHTDFDDDSIEIFGRLIKQNKNICSIDLTGNKITDKGVEMLSEYIIGNTSINKIYLVMNKGITNYSLEIIKNMVKTSYISCFDVYMTNINNKEIDEIDEILKIPVEEREIPLFTIRNVKSASKKAD